MLPSLTSLDLNNCKLLTNAGIKFLAEEASFRGSLTSLNLNNSSGISDEGLDALKAMPRLRTLSLYGLTEVHEGHLPSRGFMSLRLPCTPSLLPLRHPSVSAPMPTRTQPPRAPPVALLFVQVTGQGLVELTSLPLTSLNLQLCRSLSAPP